VIVVVALDEPNSPSTCCALALAERRKVSVNDTALHRQILMIDLRSPICAGKQIKVTSTGIDRLDLDQVSQLCER
jgi:hypothetical protein